MSFDERERERSRAKWRYRGDTRPDFAELPGPGRESVWDYPRPPRVETDPRRVRVQWGDLVVAASARAVRVLETASPPTFYVPADDVRSERLIPAPGRSECEWKGTASYASLAHAGELLENVAWSYPAPLPGFEEIAGYFSFYPARVECWVGEERVQPQPGGFYGGWVTSEIVGPFKGEAGTEGW